MEWTLKLEHRDSEGTLHSSTLATIDPPELIDESGPGMSHDTGKHPLWLIQMEVATAQVRSFIAKARRCSGCGRMRSIKDRRRRRIDTIFGQVRVPAPRFEPCRCGQVGDLSSLTSLFPHRATPELCHLHASLGGDSHIARQRNCCGSFCRILTTSIMLRSAIASSKSDSRSRPKPRPKFPRDRS